MRESATIYTHGQRPRDGDRKPAIDGASSWSNRQTGHNTPWLQNISEKAGAWETREREKHGLAHSRIPAAAVFAFRVAISTASGDFAPFPAKACVGPISKDRRNSTGIGLQQDERPDTDTVRLRSVAVLQVAARCLKAEGMALNSYFSSARTISISLLLRRCFLDVSFNLAQEGVAHGSPHPKRAPGSKFFPKAARSSAIASPPPFLLSGTNALTERTRSDRFRRPSP